MADGLGGLGQRVSPVDHRCDLSGFGAFGGRAGARPLPPAGGGTAWRAASARPRISSSSGWLRALAGPSSCVSWITGQSRSARRAGSVGSRPVIARPSRSGAAVTPAPVPAPGPSGAAAQQRHPGPLRSGSCRPAGNAALSARPASPARDRGKAVLRLSGGAGATVARAGAASRLNSPAGHGSSGPGQVTGRRRQPMPGQGRWPDHHATPAGIPGPACGPAGLRWHRREIVELAGFEHTARRVGGLGPAPPAAGRVACEQSPVNRRGSGRG